MAGRLKNLKPQNIVFQKVPSGRKKDALLERLARLEWERVVTECQKKGKKIWESRIYRFEGVKKNDNKIQILVSELPYSFRIGARAYTHLFSQKGLKYAPLGMYTSCLVKAADQKYVLLKKGEKLFATQKFSLPGGVLSWDEMELKTGWDLWQAVRWEIWEELGLRVEDRKISLHSAFVTQTFNFCFLFEVNLPQTSTQLETHFATFNSPEVSSFVFVSREEILRFAPKIVANNYCDFNAYSS